MDKKKNKEVFIETLICDRCFGKFTRTRVVGLEKIQVKTCKCLRKKNEIKSEV